MMREINASIAVDKRLWREDIAASRAHAAMLGRQGILSEADAKAIDEGLAAVGLEIGEGRLNEDPALEDIHMHVEHRLGELIGDAAGRLHTARARATTRSRRISNCSFAIVSTRRPAGSMRWNER